MVDNEEEDSLEYRMTNTFIFRPDLSNGLTGSEVITAPHPLIMVGFEFKCIGKLTLCAMVDPKAIFLSLKF